MRRVPLGKTGITVSRLCFGTLTLGPLQADLELDAGAEVLARAIELGVDFCDTAELYETYPYIRRAMELTKRYDLTVSTKTYAYTKQMAKDAVEQARRMLNRDYIDIFMLHEQESVHTLDGHREALDYLFECKQKGIVKAVGASMHHVAAVYGAVQKELDVIHPLLNVGGLGIMDGTREDMERAVRLAHERGTGVFGMKALGGGNLFKRASECLEYALGLDFLDSVAIGMQSADEVEANVKFFADGFFSRESEDILNAKTRLLHIDSWCTGCATCVSRCPQNAMEIRGGKAMPVHEQCLLCGYCAAACPQWAIKVL